MARRTKGSRACPRSNGSEWSVTPSPHAISSTLRSSTTSQSCTETRTAPALRPFTAAAPHPKSRAPTRPLPTTTTRTTTPTTTRNTICHRTTPLTRTLNQPATAQSSQSPPSPAPTATWPRRPCPPQAPRPPTRPPPRSAHHSPETGNLLIWYLQMNRNNYIDNYNL